VVKCHIEDLPNFLGDYPTEVANAAVQFDTGRFVDIKVINITV